MSELNRYYNYNICVVFRFFFPAPRYHRTRVRCTRNNTIYGRFSVFCFSFFFFFRNIQFTIHNTRITYYESYNISYKSKILLLLIFLFFFFFVIYVFFRRLGVVARCGDGDQTSNNHIRRHETEKLYNICTVQTHNILRAIFYCVYCRLSYERFTIILSNSRNRAWCGSAISTVVLQSSTVRHSLYDLGWATSFYVLIVSPCPQYYHSTNKGGPLPKNPVVNQAIGGP